MLLSCLTGAVVICVISVIRLFSRARALDRSNRELDQANRRLDAANRDLNRAAEAKGRFVASLSHELRNPLGAVIGFAELLASERSGPLTERQREHVGMIGASAEHILGLSSDLLDMARIEAGHVRLAPEPVRPADVVADCAASLTRLASSREVRIELESDPGPCVELDRGRLRQLILNFLSNALKFSPAGATVTVRVAMTAPERLRVAVVDRGVGIAAADQSRIFDEFFQVPGSERAGSSGLGLAITKLLVTAQGGSVGVDSEPGRGSTFWAELPAPPADQPEPIASVASPGAPEIRIRRRPELVAGLRG